MNKMKVGSQFRHTVSGNTTLLKSTPGNKSQLTAPLETIPENQKFGAQTLQSFSSNPRSQLEVGNQTVDGEEIINDELMFKYVMTRDYANITDL